MPFTQTIDPNGIDPAHKLTSTKPNDTLKVLVSRFQKSWCQTYHFQRPDPSNPHLQLSFHAFNTFQIHAFPPASSRRLSPEKKKLLCHADGIVACKVAFDVRP
jgi:hypothetical protein